jgi:hypothetical protein
VDAASLSPLTQVGASFVWGCEIDEVIEKVRSVDAVSTLGTNCFLWCLWLRVALGAAPAFTGAAPSPLFTVSAPITRLLLRRRDGNRPAVSNELDAGPHVALPELAAKYAVPAVER